VITQLQLLFFSALAFTVLMRTGIYPPELKSVNLDFDWTYRKLFPAILRHAANFVSTVMAAGSHFIRRKRETVIRGLYQSHGPEGRMAKVWPTGSMVLWIAIILSATLIVNFF
jgi:multicomponent Na+:H+ antiporter subunit D